MPITILDPGDEPRAAVSSAAPRLASLRGIVLGVVDNGKHNSRFMLDQLADILRGRHDIQEVIYVTKSSASLPVPRVQAEKLAGTCAAVLAGVGD